MGNQELIYLDDLTGLNNRRAFRETLEKYLAEPAQLTQGLFVILTDLDHFKNINDTHGHLSGDQMIKEFAALLTEGLKGTDCLICRYGGDEFVVIMKGTDREKAVNIWDKIRQDLNTKEFTLSQDNQKIHVTMSIGIAEYPGDGKASDDLFSRADQALYSSKYQGRNRICLAKDILSQVKEEKKVQDFLLKPRFSGREEELTQMQELLFQDQPCKLVLVEGDVGSGKTRLLKEAYLSAGPKGRNGFLLTCSELSQDKPYGLIADMISIIGYSHGDLFKGMVERLQPKQKLVLSNFPSLKTLIGAPETAQAWDTQSRLHLFDGLTGLFELLVQELKPVLLIDNIDWMDEASAETLSFLLVSKKDIPLSLCVSDSRIPGGLKKKRSFLDRLLERVFEFEIVPRLTLKPLSEPATRSLVEGIFGPDRVPDSFFKEVFEVTKGSPFFITELIRDLLSRSVIYLKYPLWVFNEKKEALPRDLKELLTNKFKNLDAEEKELLLAAAGIGSNFKFDFLAKLKKINSGYLEDCLAKSADQNIFKIEEIGARGSASFNNELSRSLFYESLDPETKKKLHLDIATQLESENQDNIDNVSSELAYHFSRAELKERVEVYAGRAAAYADKLFSDAETEKLIEQASRQREEKDRLEPVQDASWPFIVEIVSALNSAIKNMLTYQGPNDLTDRMINRCMPALEQFFLAQNNLTFSSPQGDIKTAPRLLINGQEFRAVSTVEEMVSKRLIEIMGQFNIGSITIHRAVSKAEVEAFVRLLSNPKLVIEKKELWQKALADNKILSIKIDTALYKRVLSEEEEKQFRKDFIKNFVAEKVALEDELLGPGAPVKPGTSGAGSVDRRIEGVTREERNVLAKTISRMPAEVVLQTIAGEYANRKNAISDIKEMVSVYLKNTKEREAFLQVLSSQLVEKQGMSRECFAWLIDDADFLKLPVSKRGNIYIQTDAKTLLEMGVAENLAPTLTELFTQGEEEACEKIMDKYLNNFLSPVKELRIFMAATLTGILPAIPDNRAGFYLRKIVSAFMQAVKNEADSSVSEFLAKDAGLLFNQLQELRHGEDIRTLLILFQGCPQPLKALDLQPLGLRLLARMDEAAFKKDQNDAIIGLFRQMMPEAVPHLLNLLLRRPSKSLPFEWYMQNLQVMELLKEFKEKSVGEARKMLGTAPEETKNLILDILKNLQG
jgi:diguanylate cyclase (GGDEF)-like protein